MNKIKFSHRYTKLENMPTLVILLQIFKCHFRDLSKLFIQIDTSYLERGIDCDVYCNYKLPKTELIVLLFRGLNTPSSSHPKMFTTIRRYTSRKYEYYKSKMGEIFEVEIKEEK